MSKPTEPYKCVFSLTHGVLVRTATVCFKLGRLSVTGDAKPDVEDFALATRSTLALEGVTLKPSQMRGINKGEDVPSAPLASAINALYARMAKVDPFDPAFLKTFEDAVWHEGVPHRMSRRVASFPYPIPMHARIQPMLEGIYKFARSGKNKVHPLNLACLVYFEFMAIQPYSEYTGILARYLLKAIAGRAYPELYRLPLERLMLVHKDKVDAAYAAAVEKGDTGPFLSYMMDLFAEGIDSMLRQSVRKSPEQSAGVVKLLSKMEDGRFYSATELCALLGLKSRLGLQKNYIKPALEAKAIEMSNPLSPTDRTQRYRKK